MASPGRARGGPSGKPDSGAGNGSSSSRNARIATAAQPVAISYTYGSPVPQNTGLEYEPPAKTWAREKRNRDGSASAGVNANAGGTETMATTAQDENQAGSGSHGGATAGHISGKSSHSTTTTLTKVTLSGSGTSAHPQSRARGASLVQQSQSAQDPAHVNKILKDTSVNIATAFRQAAGSASVAPAGASAPGMNAAAASGDAAAGSAGGGGVAFLGRAGDRDALVQGRQQARQQDSSTHIRSVAQDEAGDEDGEGYDRSTESADTEQLQLQNTSTTANASLAGKKRKKGKHFKGAKDKDPAFRPPKKTDGVVSDSEEYASDDESVDLEELRQEYGIAAPSLSASASGSAAQPSTSAGAKGKQRAKPKKKVQTRKDGASNAEGDAGEGEGEGAGSQEEGAADLAEESEAGDGRAATKGAKRTARRRKSGPKDTAYKPGQDSEYSEDYSDVDEHGARTRRRRRKAGTGASAGSAAGRSAALQRNSRDDSVLSTERGDEQDDSNEREESAHIKSEMTSYYLHAPSEEPSDAQSQSDRRSAPPEPEFQPPSKPGAPLATVQPKASNNGTTYQPYFAFSTSAIGTGPGRRVAQNGASSFLRNLAGGSGIGSATQRPRAPSTSTSVDTASQAHGAAGNETTFNLGRALPGGYGDLSLAGRQSTTGGPSSNASFDLRGSDYDYAEEERMTNALLAARERGETGRKLPEGRQILPLGMGAANGARVGDRSEAGHGARNASLAPSEQSSEFSMGSAAQSQANGKPRRGPAPPGPPGLRRSPSNFSDRASQDLPPTSTSTSASKAAAAAGQGSPRQKSVGRKLGELVRKMALLVYWCVVGPITLLRDMGWRNAWKWAAVIALLGLMLGSMNERATSSSASQKQHRPWYYSILPSSSSASTQPTFQAPHTVPANIDELVSRLTNLETTFSILSQAQASDHASSVEHARQQSDSARRLAALEGDFESERSRAGKAHDGLVKASQRETERLDAGLKGASSQLEYLSDRLKTLASERKQDTTESARLRSEMARVNNDLAQLGKRVTGLDSDLQESRDVTRLTALVTKRIEEMLPARMAVSVDSKTGEVKLDPRFWSHLKTAFASQSSSSKDGGASAGQPANWEAFLAHNEADLRRLIDGGVQDHVTKGAIVSRASFMEVLERDLLALKNEISRTSSDGLAKLSSEFSGKLSKLTHSASKASSSAPTTKIKLSSGENLDALVAPLIDAALARYSKDVLARPDFALYSSGGRVIPSLTSPTYEVRPPGSALSPSRLLARLTGLGVLRGKPPVTALHPDIAVGRCWPFAGRSGQLGILLSRRIIPSEITLEHAAKEVALDVTSAPRRFEVWALVEEHDGRERLAAYHAQREQKEDTAPLDRQLLLEGDYDASKENHIQTFAVPQEIQDLQIPVGVVLLRIIDNHGNEDLSCLYRVRVGGTPLSSGDIQPGASASISVEKSEEA